MIWDKFSKKEKIGLTFALVIFAIAMFDQMLISPVRRWFSGINQQIRISEKQLGGDLRNINQKEFISQEYEQYLSYIRRSGSDEEEVAKILGEIEALARKSSVYLVDMKPRKPRDVEFYKEYTVEIEAEGYMESLVSFVYQLNTSSQLLRIETLRLNLSKGDSKVLSASMLITKVLIL